MDELLAKWEEIKEAIRKEHNLSDISYKTWILPLKLYNVEKDKIVILIPFDQAQSLNYINNKYSLPIKVAIAEAVHKEYEIEFVLEKDIKTYKSSSISDSSNNVNYERANLNSKYTFNTFVVGGNNRFAHSASLAVAESPGEVYNPLFLYGGVGLGKTHLMHSIAHFIIENNPNAKVLYVTSEQFTNEVIDAIRIGNNSPTAMKKFREKYRNIDVLLIDDIQFIIGKESTQEEFFHTFNQLHEEKKQIIISSDKPPKDMDILEERYKSRFGWGLIADIQSPDYETRMAILQKKEEMDGYEIDEAVIQYIANNVKSNIRELEGALNKLIALSNLEKKEITLELAEEALKDIISPNIPNKITPEYIIEVVSEHFNIPPSDIYSKKRNSEIVLPRQIIMYLCRQMTDAPLTKIASLLGKKDHTTILHGEKKISADIETDESLKNSVETIKKKINLN
ncbi:MAG: chromosomal replication initiator protein DnaA [Lachnospiraceae bacterium]